MNAADRKDVRRAEKAEKLRETQEREVLIQIAETAAGRRWLWDQMAASHVFSTSFHESPTIMAFNEGRRNQGLVLLSQMMRHCPQQFTLAMQEANDRDQHIGSADRDGSAEGPESGDDGGAPDLNPNTGRPYSGL